MRVNQLGLVNPFFNFMVRQTGKMLVTQEKLPFKIWLKKKDKYPENSVKIYLVQCQNRQRIR